jgi:hypothetical protein
LQSHASLLFISSLDLLPDEIFGTEEVPEYMLSDSSTVEEDATLEQRTNHQLRRRMSLEVLIGDKIFIFI